MITKIITALTLLMGAFLVFRKKDPPTDEGVEDYTPNQALARKEAYKIKIALNVGTGFWGWSEDEEAVIKSLNDNFDIQNIIAIEYKKLTNNIMMDDISKFLSVEEIEKININRI